MNLKRLAIFSIFLVLLSGFATSALVSNSESWKDNSLVIARSHFEGEEVHAVTSLSEGQLIEEMLRDNRSHTVYEPENGDDAVWENYANYLRNEGKQDISSTFLNWQESQYDYYSDVEEEVEGIVVIRPGFAMDTLSVYPQIINGNYWPIYYNGDDTDRFLQRQASDKDVIFYGEYIEQPWRGLDSNYTIISEGSKEENNVRLVGRIAQEYDSESAIVAGDSYLEKGFMKKGDPIILGQSIEDTAQVIRALDVSTVEVIGAENVGFGNSLEDQVGDSTTIIAKFGRRFTGAQGLDSTYPVKQIPATPVVRDISVSSVKVSDSGNMVELVFDNEGTIDTAINLSAVAFSSGNQEELISRQDDIISRPGRNITIDFNSSIGFSPENAEVSFTYQGSEGISSRSFNVENVDSWAASEISLEDVYYSEPQERLAIEIRNQGENTTYVGAQIHDLKVINRSVNPTTDQIVEITPGDTETVYVDAYMSEEALERNNQLDLAVTAGDAVHTSKDLHSFEEVQLEVREGGVLVVIVQYGPYVVILLILLLLLYLIKKRRDQKKYRGLK
ncbi:hypothetical protein ACK3SF_01305 [Candidatus Nanosalina sp. VS9-1]|uniref:hypothetical protein n=1 Tax=Candidatus Nanosalina sp. VS9-1 TaxID=3388566 RepID=UPI0039E11E59